MIRILSIDGGGIRGIIPALILAKIEKYTGKPISKLFELVCGTSTGGILALGLAAPGNDRTARYNAADLAGLYEIQGARIFSRSGWRRLLPAGNLFDQKYPSSGIDSVLDEYFADISLSQSLTNVLVTSYEIERRFPFFFRSHWALRDPAYDFPMKAAARATSAAPTYFEPYKLPAPGPAGYYALVDGGVFANNPAMCAITESMRTFGAGQPHMVVSLGTGSLSRPLEFERARHWGVAQWAKPLLDVVFDGVSSTVDYQLRLSMNPMAGPRNYYRIQPPLYPSLEPMDNASADQIRRLKLLAENSIWEHQRDLAEICDRLVSFGDAADPMASVESTLKG